MENKIHIYTGDGKGKTTAAIGLVIRALGAGKKVAMVQFDKGSDDKNNHYFERHILTTLPNFDLYAAGADRMAPNQPFRYKHTDDDYKEAERALILSKRLISEHMHSLVILDEILACVVTRLLTQKEVMSLLDLYESNRRPCELVLTGHATWDELIERADLVTKMQNVKHYFDQGIKAREGIDY